MEYLKNVDVERSFREWAEKPHDRARIDAAVARIREEDRGKPYMNASTRVGLQLGEVTWQSFWTDVRQRGIEKRREHVREVMENPPERPGWLRWLLETGKLSPAQGQALDLTYRYGLTEREAARTLGIHRSSYRDRLRLARRNMQTIQEAAARVNGKRLSQVRRGKNLGRARVSEPAPPAVEYCSLCGA